MEALMQTRSSMSTAAVEPAKREERLHRLMLAVVLYWACSIYIDASHHAHDGFRIESFFIWEHLPLYADGSRPVLCSPFTTCSPGDSAFPSRSDSRPTTGSWQRAPWGMDSQAEFDMLWHGAFGFEQNLAVTWSPSHLALKAADFVVLAGLLRYSLSSSIGK